jgi:hypothetical protein
MITELACQNSLVPLRSPLTVLARSTHMEWRAVLRVRRGGWARWCKIECTRVGKIGEQSFHTLDT